MIINFFFEPKVILIAKNYFVEGIGTVVGTNLVENIFSAAWFFKE